MNGEVLLAAVTSAAAIGAGVVSARFRATCMKLEAELSRQTASFRASKDALERLAREATEECERLQGLTLAGARLTGDPVFSGRTAPRDAEELARLVRGMTLVDDVVITSPSGLALSRETTPRSARLAALGPALFETLHGLAAAGLSPREISLEMADATHVVARPLSGRGEGTILLVATTSRRASGAVLDTVAHAAARADSAKGPSARPTPWSSSDPHEAASRGFGSSLVSALDRALREEHRGLVLLEGPSVLLSGARSGPSRDARASGSRALAALALRAASCLASGSLHIEVALSPGYRASWSTCAPGPHAVVTFGEANLGSLPRLDRLVGVVRRALEGRGEAAISGDAA
jgi:hypothetical protein